MGKKSTTKSKSSSTNKSGSSTKSSVSKRQSTNVKTGIRAEKRVQNRLDQYFSFPVERENPDKSTYDQPAKPDLWIDRDDYDIPIEVKSVAEYISGSKVGETENRVHGRAQIRRDEIEDLKSKDGVFIFEIRDRNNRTLKDTGKREYRWAFASDIEDMVKGEVGDEVKVEYDQIKRMPKLTKKMAQEYFREDPPEIRIMEDINYIKSDKYYIIDGKGNKLQSRNNIESAKNWLDNQAVRNKPTIDKLPEKHWMIVPDIDYLTYNEWYSRYKPTGETHLKYREYVKKLSEGE